MRFDLRARLVVASLAVVLAATLVADLWIAQSIERELNDRIESDMIVRVTLIEREASQLEAATSDLAAWDALADALGAATRGRVTFVDLEGRVVGDSEVSLADLPLVENHLKRPEIVAAAEGSVGTTARRDSGTLHRRMLYVATRFSRGGQLTGFARLAVPLSEVDEAIGQVHRVVAVSTLLALCVAVILSLVAASWLTRRTNRLVEGAARMAGGDLETRLNSRETDEFGRIGGALDRLASSLASTLSQLRHERDLLGGILAGMQEGVLLVDEAGRIALVNPALREMLLLGDVLGKPPIEVVRHAELTALLEKARKSGQTESGDIELAGLKPRRLLVRVLALSGEPAGLLAVFVDVTDLRRLESLRRDFVANVSHELRTPVTAIRSATETLREALQRDPQAVAMFVDIIDRSAERMHRLVEDLLDLSKIDAREYELTLEPVVVSEVAAQALALLRERSEAKRLLISVDLAGSVVRADRRALDQVLSNLLENAIKYCPEGATIRIFAVPAGASKVRVVVQDSGPGLEPKHLARVFERFYRVDKGRSRDVGGTGLGLSIVKNLVEAMGGEVGVESTPGAGSAFSVTLPKG